jgi:carbamoyl-phosphate synthase/aspartate carbamoyltransferase
MAVDYAVPLVTNVKCAKLMVAAIVREPTLDICSADFKTSHETFTFPGLVSIQTFVPGVAKQGSQDFAAVTQAAVRAGFSMIQALPQGVGSRIEDEVSLALAQANANGSAHCDYLFGIAATADNASRFEGGDITSGTRSLFVPASFASNTVNKVATVAGHFAAWPQDKPIVTDAKTTDLASILLLASLHSRNVHVVNVKTRDDILLIALSKEKGLKVTCDVAVYSLFFAKEQFPGSTCLPSAEDQKALWENLAVIDTFSVGSIPYQLALDLKKDVSASTGIEETLPLLLGAVSEGRLTLEDITLRLHDNPRAIFNLPEQSQTYVEVDIDRKTVFSGGQDCWSPLASKTVSGVVHRVVLNGKSAFLDGNASSSRLGRDLSADAVAAPRVRKTSGRPSFSRAQRPSIAPIASTMSPPSIRSPTKGPEFFQSSSNIMSLTSVAPLPSLKSSLQPHPSFHRRHVLSVKQYTREDLHHIFNLATEMRTQVERNGALDLLKGRVLSTLFYEPSTRTSASFETAMKRLGGDVTVINADASSVRKGESLADTVRTLGCYADAIVIRHPEVGSAKNAAKFSPVPIINAGDGIGEHPSQVSCSIFIFRLLQ